MTRRAFTLIELMVVVAIMAAMATLSINAYRAVVKGMRDRAALVAVQTLVDAARQRAEIDRKQVNVYFYDECQRTADASTGAELSGHGIAIAVRPTGRVSRIDGNFICDEFGDLDQMFAEENQLDSDLSANGGNSGAMLIYRLADGSFAEVRPTVVDRSSSASYILSGNSSTGQSSDDGEKMILCYAFEKTGGGASFAPGDAYGSEFATVVLPDGYYFGSSAPTTVGRRQIGKIMEIKPAQGAKASGDDDVKIYAVRAGSAGLDEIGSTKTGGN